LKEQKEQNDIYTDVEYAQIFKDGISLYVYDANELNGKSKMEFQKMLGDQFGPGMFLATIKRKNIMATKNYRIRAIKFGSNKKIDNTETQSDHKIKDLENKMNNMNNNSPTFDQILILTKQTYTLQIESLKDRINELKSDLKEKTEIIEKLQSKLTSLENENNSGGGLMDMIQQAVQLKQILKPNVPIKSLKDIPTDRNSIPEQFINALGKVDYTKVPQEDIEKYVNFFENFSNQLPLKTKTEV